jgi:hypothetical protein
MTKCRNEALASTTTPTRMWICFVITCLLLILSHYICNIVMENAVSKWSCISGKQEVENQVRPWGQWPPHSLEIQLSSWGKVLGITRGDFVVLLNTWTNSRQLLCYKGFNLSRFCNVIFTVMTAWCLLSYPPRVLQSLLQDESQNCKNIWGGSNIVMQVSKPINYFTIN